MLSSMSQQLDLQVVQIQAGLIIQTDDQWLNFVSLKSQQVSSHFPEVIIRMVQYWITLTIM